MKWLKKIRMRTKLMLLLLPAMAVFLTFGGLYLADLGKDVMIISWNRDLRTVLDPFENLFFAIQKEEDESEDYMIGLGSEEDLQKARTQLDQTTAKFKSEIQGKLEGPYSILMPYRSQLLEQLSNIASVRAKINKKENKVESIGYYLQMDDLIYTAINEANKLYRTQEIFSKPHHAYYYLLGRIMSFSYQNFLIETILANQKLSSETLIQLASSIERERLMQQNFDIFATPYQKEIYQEVASSPWFERSNIITKMVLEENFEEGHSNLRKQYLEAANHKEALLHQLLDTIRKQLSEHSASVRAGSITILVIVSVVLGVVSFIIIFLGFKIVRDILDVLSTLQSYSKYIEEKDFTHATGEISRSDEFGALEKSYFEVGKTIKQVVQRLREEIDHITHSSANIVSAVNELATGQRETEHAVVEINATVEELRQSSEHASEKAKNVVSLSQETLEKLNLAIDAVHATVDDLNKIHEKMAIISESTTKLSEHCQAIGSIIDSVHDLADQSHVLAVNASIEAAKAGEQGKGFAIVAQEMRNLAEQSKTATKQVHGILTDIQNAMNTAVLATEQGSTTVSKGVEQSAATKESIEYFSTGMDNMIHFAEDVSETGLQQLTSISQTAQAMMDIKKATSEHQNQSSQIETSITDLHVISEKLSFIINEFKLPKSESDGPHDGK